MAEDNGPIVSPGPSGGGGGDGTQAPYAGYKPGTPLENYVDPTEGDQAADTAATDQAPSGGPVQDLPGTGDQMPEAHPGALSPAQIRQIKMDVANHKSSWRRTTFDNPVEEAQFQRDMLNSSWGLDMMSRFGMSKQQFLDMVKSDPTYDYRKLWKDKAIPDQGALPPTDGKGGYYMSPYAPGMWSHYYQQATGKDAYETGVNNRMFNDMLHGQQPMPGRRMVPQTTAFLGMGGPAAPAGPKMRNGEAIGPDGYTASEREYMKGAGIDPSVRPATPPPAAVPSAPAGAAPAPPQPAGIRTRQQQQKEDLERIQKGLDPLQGQKPRSALGGKAIARAEKPTGGGGTLDGSQAPGRRKDRRDEIVEQPENKQVTADTETA